MNRSDFKIYLNLNLYTGGSAIGLIEFEFKLVIH